MGVGEGCPIGHSICMYTVYILLFNGNIFKYIKMYLSQLFLAKSIESTGGSFAIRHCDSSNLDVPLPPSLTWNPEISPSKGDEPNFGKHQGSRIVFLSHHGFRGP